jgi:CRISPR-associated protein Csb1
MTVTKEAYDALLSDDGPAAIIFSRRLIPVEGKDAWIFPPTFARSESEDDEGESKGDYQISALPDDPRRNVCEIDSVGSQANRMEPIFKRDPYRALVPQHKIKMRNGDEINLLDVGHRAADAAVRFTKRLGPQLFSAFKAYRDKRDSSELIKLAPTSLVFGVWDSRGTGAKIQRIVRSVIRAYNVTKGSRSATFQAAYDYVGSGTMKPQLDKGSGKANLLSQEGFKYSLATDTPGGVLVNGDVEQRATINLVALRTLTPDQKARRYLLALSLVALSYRDQTAFNLREGCLLRAECPCDLNGRWLVVSFDGTSDGQPLKDVTHDHLLKYAEAVTVSDEYHVVQPKEGAEEFDQSTAEAYLEIEKKKRKQLGKRMHPSDAVKQKKTKPAEGEGAKPEEPA